MCIIQALRFLRRLAQESSGEVGQRGGQQPAVLRGLSQRLARWAIVGHSGPKLRSFRASCFSEFHQSMLYE